MDRYKDYNYYQMKMIPVSYEKQILPGSFEYSLSWLIDNELDLSAFETYYRNDEGGRPAYDPRLLLKPVIEGIRETFHASPDKGELEGTKITADSGYHNREMLEYLEGEGIDGYIADTGFRARDPRFRDHKAAPARNKRQEQNRFSQADFRIDTDKGSCRCPAGYEMWLKAKSVRIGHYLFMQFQGYEKDCNACRLRSRCLRSHLQTTPRQVNVRLETRKQHTTSAIERMKEKIDSVMGRHLYGQRLGTVEPVFGHLTDAIGIKRFSLRGKRKVDGQWKLMMMLHNMLKIHRYGWEWA